MTWRSLHVFHPPAHGPRKESMRPSPDFERRFSVALEGTGLTLHEVLVPIIEVNGADYRDLQNAPSTGREHDTFFGGHHDVYPDLPSGPVYIDSELADKDAIAVHEMTEHYLMSKKGWPYHKAHNLAEQVERRYRGVA